MQRIQKTRRHYRAPSLDFANPPNHFAARLRGGISSRYWIPARDAPAKFAMVLNVSLALPLSDNGLLKNLPVQEASFSLHLERQSHFESHRQRQWFTKINRAPGFAGG